MEGVLRHSSEPRPPGSGPWTTTEQDRRITEIFERAKGRLWNFIRKRVLDETDAEDIFQDVFYEFIEAYRIMKPIEQSSAWLFRVARNRIIDFFRKKRTDLLRTEPARGDTEEPLNFENLLPSPDSGPDAAFARKWLLAELDHALDELPDEQREVFIAHEIEGRSFKEIAAETGISVNTLLSRKHYAVLHLRERLQTIYVEFAKL